MPRSSRALLPGLAVAAAAFVPSPRQSAPVTIEPAQVEMTMLFTGSRVHVGAPVARGAQVAVVLEGTPRTLALKRKGKVLGFIWMNVGDVVFEAVPDVYLLRTTCPLAALAERSVRERLGVGLDALGALPENAGVDRSLFDELVRLKWRDGLWNVSEATVTVRPNEIDGNDLADTDFFLPARTPPGEYRIRVFAFVEGKAELAGEGRLRVAQAGGAAFISDLAERHGLLYGILAVVVAGAAGLLTGVVFGLGSKKGH